MLKTGKHLLKPVDRSVKQEPNVSGVSDRDASSAHSEIASSAAAGKLRARSEACTHHFLEGATVFDRFVLVFKENYAFLIQFI